MSKIIHFTNEHMIGSIFIMQNTDIPHEVDFYKLSLCYCYNSSSIDLHITAKFKINDISDHLNLYENLLTSNVIKIDGDTIVINTLNNNSTISYTHKNIHNGIFKIKLNNNGMNRFARWFNKFYAVV